MNTRILVPIDGSEHSEKVVSFAADIAKARDGDITLMHVIPHMPVPNEFAHYVQIENINTPPSALYEESLGREVLEHFEVKLRDRGIKSVVTRVETGHVASTVIETAREISADIVVIGTHGASAWQGIALGSVAQKICHSAPCTVLMVK